MDDRLNAATRDIPRPKRLAWRPISPDGYLIPWFVAYIDGKPDFRIADREKFGRAIRHDLCWMCGNSLGRHKVFLIGPMCGVNRTTAEPPCHRECAEYAAQACPFLSRPRMRRNENDLPGTEEQRAPGGIMIKRNPGAVLLWITKAYRLERQYGGGVLFKLGEPHELVVYAGGKVATRDALDASIASGLPLLAQIAEEEGPDAVAALHRQVDAADALFKRLLPPRAAVA